MSLLLHKAEKVGKGGKAASPASSKKPRRTVQLSYLEAILLFLLLIFLILLLWSTDRSHPSLVRVPNIDNFEQALPSIASLSGSTILPGNAVQVLQNGDQFFPSLFADIAQAGNSIHLETYVWWKGEICDRLGRALADKARHGVEVRVTLDAGGAFKADDHLFDTMEKAGVKVAYFHPFRLSQLGLLNNRTHRKLAIFDGKVAYVFGHGIAEEWTGHAQDAKHWRDTGVRLTGPIVNSVQAVFAQNWVDETAEVLVGERYFPPLPPTGTVRAHMTASAPRGGVSQIEMIDKLAIATAQKELIIENPYFIPRREMVNLLVNAARRGVRVRIMIPGPVTDSGVVRHAGHKRLQPMLDNGIEIYEFQTTLNHQKIMIIDGMWSFVGSANFDGRSLNINDEASVGLIDAKVAAQLKDAFEADLRRCKRFDARAWRQRSPWHRLQDAVSYMFNPQL